MATLNPEDAQRFWDKVDKTPGHGPGGDCWLWTSQLREGYGLFRLNGKIVSAHRVSLAMTGVDIEGRVVRHNCDTPACVRPEHLLVGTQQNNVDDMHLRGRRQHTLTNEQVTEIRQRPLSGTICRDLAKEFGVSPSQIKKVLTGQAYSWLPGARDLPPQFTAYKFTPEQLEEIVAELANAKWGTQTRLAKKYGVTRGTISHINRLRVKYAQPDTQ